MINNLNFNELLLHDSELMDTILNYNNKKVKIKFRFLDKGEYINKEIIFNDFIYFNMTNYFPWGESLYINEGKIITDKTIINKLNDFDKDLTLYTHFNLLLNSGDNIDIMAKNYHVI